SSRIQEHKEGIYKESFTHRYNLHFLIYFEFSPSIEEAIEREKQIKKFSRKKKELLINTINPLWNDLTVDLEYID
ncbi:MAG: Excinuclease subunit domain protein, partial [Bacteroidota bacterium]|nr:Excinuclease subunit domain protein [Bacteroidota bacterium]